MSDAIRIKDGSADYVPNGWEVAKAMCADEYSRKYQAAFFQTLRLLLLAGFCLLICCGPAAGQKFTVHVQPNVRKFTVTVQQSAATESQGEYYVVLYTAEWCGSCRQYKNDGRLDRLRKMLHVKIIDTDTERRWHKGRLPCFWLCRRAGSIPLHKWEPGTISPETIAAKLKEIQRRTVTDPTEVNSLPEGFYDSSIYNGQPGSSHQNRSSLIQHLYNDGIHKGLREMAALNAMSDAELDATHDRDHKPGK